MNEPRTKNPNLESICWSYLLWLQKYEVAWCCNIVPIWYDNTDNRMIVSIGHAVPGVYSCGAQIIILNWFQLPGPSSGPGRIFGIQGLLQQHKSLCVPPPLVSPAHMELGCDQLHHYTRLVVYYHFLQSNIGSKLGQISDQHYTWY